MRSMWTAKTLSRNPRSATNAETEPLSCAAMFGGHASIGLVQKYFCSGIIVERYAALLAWVFSVFLELICFWMHASLHAAVRVTQSFSSTGIGHEYEECKRAMPVALVRNHTLLSSVRSLSAWLVFSIWDFCIIRTRLCNGSFV